MKKEKLKFVLATGNAGKLAEIRDFFSSERWDVLPQSDFDIPEADETGLTFIENAIIKARHASQLTGLPALADDSGLEVAALNGSPGIYSARYAGTRASAAANNSKLLETMQLISDKEQRKACFRCVMVYMRNPVDPMPLIGIGTWHGYILQEPRGNLGHGYDPVFYVPEYQCSAAELAPELKNQLSHRGMAIRQMLGMLEEEI